jgi:hypothetical protein
LSRQKMTEKKTEKKGGGIRRAIVLTCSVAVLLFPLAAAAPTVALSGGSALSVLVNQIGDPGGHFVSSNQFTKHPFEPYSAYGADNFDVPATLTKGWSVRVIRAVGEGGGCVSETAVFYTDAPGEPGTEVAERSGLGDWNNGTYTLTFSSPVQLAKNAKYWVSFYCTKAGPFGWYWLDSVVLHGDAAQWENPSGAISDCRTWGNMNSCLGLSGEPDFEFALLGRAT